MSEPVQPSDLYFRLQDALGALRDVRRTVGELSREYADLDAAELAVDTLGDALSPADALGRTRAGLADVVLTYVAPTLLGGPRVAIGDLGVNTMSEARKMRLLSTHRLGEDVLFVSAPVEDPEDSPAVEDAGSAEGGR